MGDVWALKRATGDVSSSGSQDARITADSKIDSIMGVFMAGSLFGITEKNAEQNPDLESEIVVKDTVVA